MDPYLELISVYTVQDALRVVQHLRGAGVDFRCEEPAFTGNCVVDWQLSAPSWTVWVSQSDHAMALSLLESLEPARDTEALWDDGLTNPAVPIDAKEADNPLDSTAPVTVSQDERKALLALRAAVFSLFACFMLPIALWLMMAVPSEELSKRGRKRLGAAVGITVTALICWSLILAWPVLQRFFNRTR